MLDPGLSVVNFRRMQFLGSREDADQAGRIMDEDRQMLWADADRRAAVLEREKRRDVRVALAEQARRLFHAAIVTRRPCIDPTRRSQNQETAVTALRSGLRSKCWGCLRFVSRASRNVLS